MWSTFHTVPLPRILRKPLYMVWTNWTGVNLDELEKPLEEYPSLAEFFSRHLKKGCRPISTRSLVSPVDALIVSCGKVDKFIEQVKGIDYSLAKFIGKNEKYHNLHQATFYLSPGDYHRYHSPCDLKIHERLHFPGRLYTVHGIVSKVIQDLFVLNERVILEGEWEHGKFLYCAIGAMNVGSIKIHEDPALGETNHVNTWFDDTKSSHCFSTHVNYTKGGEIGYFTLGSSIVLLFEAPNDFEFAIKAGDYVQMGQGL